jgi:hypothetical protein
MVALDMVNVAQKNAASVYQAGKAVTAPKSPAQLKVLLHWNAAQTNAADTVPVKMPNVTVHQDSLVHHVLAKLA